MQRFLSHRMKDLPPISYCSHGNPPGLHTWTFTAVLGKSRQVEKCLIPKTQKSQHGRGGIAQTKLSGQGQLHRLLRPYPMGSEGLQRWASHSLLGPPVLDQPWGKKVFFMSKQDFLYSGTCPLSLVFSPGTTEEILPQFP